VTLEAILGEEWFDVVFVVSDFRAGGAGLDWLIGPSVPGRQALPGKKTRNR
jgi:hypothetical protein